MCLLAFKLNSIRESFLLYFISKLGNVECHIPLQKIPIIEQLNDFRLKYSFMKKTKFILFIFQKEMTLNVIACSWLQMKINTIIALSAIYPRCWMITLLHMLHSSIIGLLAGFEPRTYDHRLFLFLAYHPNQWATRVRCFLSWICFYC